jgi:hypothetical protein
MAPQEDSEDQPLLPMAELQPELGRVPLEVPPPVLQQALLPEDLPPLPMAPQVVILMVPQEASEDPPLLPMADLQPEPAPAPVEVPLPAAALARQLLRLQVVIPTAPPEDSEDLPPLPMVPQVVILMAPQEVSEDPPLLPMADLEREPAPVEVPLPAAPVARLLLLRREALVPIPMVPLPPPMAELVPVAVPLLALPQLLLLRVVTPTAPHQADLLPMEELDLQRR